MKSTDSLTSKSVPPVLQKALHHWLKRCAILKCDSTDQEILVDTFGPMVRKGTRISRAEQIETELFAPAIGDPSPNVRLAVFCDRIFYNYNNPTDETARGLKANLLTKPAHGQLENVSWRFQYLIMRTLRKETFVAGTYPQSIDAPGFQQSSIDEYHDSNPEIYQDEELPSGAVTRILEDGTFDEPIWRQLWLRSHPSLVPKAKAANFVNLGKTQIYENSEAGIHRIKRWLDRHYPGTSPAGRINFYHLLCADIEKRLLAENTIPVEWFETIRES